MCKEQAASTSRSVAVGHFGSGGLLDLAVARSIPSGLSVLINNTLRQ